MPWCLQSLGGSAGPSVWCLHLEGKQRHHKMPQNGCLCMGKGLVRGCGGGMGAHRPCSSSRKLNENRKDTPSLTQRPKCRYALVQGLRGMAPQPFRPTQDTTGFFGPIAEAKHSSTSPACPGEEMGMGITCLPLAKESLQCPETKNTAKQMGKPNKATNKKPQNTVITS